MNEELFLNKIRPVTEEDYENLPIYSYSKIEVYKNCPLQFHKKYNEKKRTTDTSLALELGSTCHYVLQRKGEMLNEEGVADINALLDYLENGVTVTDKKTQEVLLGVKELQKKYWDIWYEPDNASGATYVDKIETFKKVLDKEMDEFDDWTPVYFEHKFNYVWDNKVIITGFIDRIDMKDGEYRTLDYKTSKKTYDSSKLATSLQFGIYALAILNEFGKLPIESKYRFILLDDEQLALTKGWEKRLIKALDKVFEQIETCEKEEIWKPSPTPLCHWCNYCEHNPDANEYKNDCEYYSLWQPNNKTFEVNKKWDALNFNKQKNKLNTENRKLIF